MKYWSVIIIHLAFGIALMSCSGQQKPSAVVAEDSVATVAVHVPTLEELTLPDTVFASVATMTYVVENEDSDLHPLKYYDDLYNREDRVMTFRKNLLRNADYGGRVMGTPTEIEVAWSFDTPYGREETKFGQVGGRYWMDRAAALRTLD
jgi:hypothetical protein